MAHHNPQQYPFPHHEAAPNPFVDTPPYAPYPPQSQSNMYSTQQGYASSSPNGGLVQREKDNPYSAEFNGRGEKRNSRRKMWWSVGALLLVVVVAA